MEEISKDLSLKLSTLTLDEKIEFLHNSSQISKSLAEKMILKFVYRELKRNFPPHVYEEQRVKSIHDGMVIAYKNRLNADKTERLEEEEKNNFYFFLNAASSHVADDLLVTGLNIPKYRKLARKKIINEKVSHFFVDKNLFIKMWNQVKVPFIVLSITKQAALINPKVLPPIKTLIEKQYQRVEFLIDVLRKHKLNHLIPFDSAYIEEIASLLLK